VYSFWPNSAAITKPSQQVINNAVEQTVAAEAAGFDTAWYAEHNFNNYSLCPSPLMMVAHCAGLNCSSPLRSSKCDNIYKDNICINTICNNTCINSTCINIM
jgi:hypothetical protein